MNRIFAFILSVLFVLNPILAMPQVFAAEPKQDTPETLQSQSAPADNTTPDAADLSAVPEQIENELKEHIANVYGREQTDEIYSNILRIIEDTKKQRPQKLVQEDYNRTSDWYKDEIVYMFYADQFGVNDNNQPSTFKNAVKMLDYLKLLGVTTIYILPFADSPMNDSGFDVRDPRNVRADLGGMKEFKEFLDAAHQYGFKVKADLVLNHLSDQHKWFQDALKGDVSKLDNFVVKDKMPEYTTYKDEKLGFVAEYKEDDGTISKRRIIFPEITDSHYRKVTINGRDYYLYHTFYPFQLDINWENPDVMYYALGTVAFWANLGIDIFRLDAIPYLIKENGTNAENLPKTHEVIKIISLFIQATAPRSVIQAEACQTPKNILPYFGSERKVNLNISGKEKEIVRTDEFQIAYHFPYMPAIWASLVSADNRYFWKAHKQTPKIPDSATWAIFLRVHDELTLEMVNAKTRELIYDDLEPKGAEFRKGFGVSGRMANFLDNDTDRIGMAFSILLSLPGIPIIYYGDEIGSQNNYTYAQRFAKLRELKQRAKNKGKNKVEMLSYFDSRDINRGAIKRRTFYNATRAENSFEGKVFKKVKQLIEVRKKYPVIARGDFTQIKTNAPEIFAYMRTLGDEQIIVINNLSDNRTVAELNIPNIPWWKKDDDVYLLDLLNNRKRRVNYSKPTKNLIMRLKPYDSVWFKVEKLSAEDAPTEKTTPEKSN